MPNRKRNYSPEPKTTKRGTFPVNKGQKTARKVELYSTAYKLALVQIPDVQRREEPDISLRIHASIRRQLKEGETDPVRMAFVAVKDTLVPTRD